MSQIWIEAPILAIKSVRSFAIIMLILQSQNGASASADAPAHETDLNELIAPPKEGKFRLNAKKLFLTYPKCSITKEEALEQLKAKLKHISKILVAHELHKDGTDHLHVYINLDKKCNIIN